MYHEKTPVCTICFCFFNNWNWFIRNCPDDLCKSSSGDTGRCKTCCPWSESYLDCRGVETQWRPLCLQRWILGGASASRLGLDSRSLEKTRIPLKLDWRLLGGNVNRPKLKAQSPKLFFSMVSSKHLQLTLSNAALSS